VREDVNVRLMTKKPNKSVLDSTTMRSRIVGTMREMMTQMISSMIARKKTNWIKSMQCVKTRKQKVRRLEKR